MSPTFGSQPATDCRSRAGEWEVTDPEHLTNSHDIFHPIQQVCWVPDTNQPPTQDLRVLAPVSHHQWRECCGSLLPGVPQTPSWRICEYDCAY